MFTSKFKDLFIIIIINMSDELSFNNPIVKQLYDIANSKLVAELRIPEDIEDIFEMYAFLYRVSLTMHPDVVSVWSVDGDKTTKIF